MAYVSIYRKYRPYNFDNVVGQEHIVRILRNQIKTDTIGHAYLFTGTRGTGKTSVAKIFARSVNCPNHNDGGACGECAVCKEMANSSNLDIVEIDAASNNGVDEIRELRESVKYPPTIGRFKVYIIDEVHMLSIGAFNALLKTLEEPPAHVIFILATTEVHKLPQTILSRCLRFDFRLVPTISIANRIKYIFDDMGIICTEDACLAIAEAGDGSVRDALSIADMCVSYGEGKVDYNVVLDVLGQSNPNIIIDIVECTLKGDVGTALSLIDGIANFGKSMSVL
ncbi:MAG: DNA polymerase III subunit gamma/tau, partial [Clostridia bacterium]|nr:DNA polymerase III subunit gamma/tau [Clostridia bacterium]